MVYCHVVEVATVRFVTHKGEEVSTTGLLLPRSVRLGHGLRRAQVGQCLQLAIFCPSVLVQDGPVVDIWAEPPAYLVDWSSTEA